MSNDLSRGTESSSRGKKIITLVVVVLVVLGLGFYLFKISSNTNFVPINAKPSKITPYSVILAAR